MKLVLWPALMVTGVAIPLRLNPVPLIAACEIVTLVPPVLVTVSEADCWLPIVTLPNASVDGVPANCPAVIPAPDNEIVAVESEALLAIVTVAVKDPAVFGVNARLRVVLCPAAMVAGKLGAVTEKLALDTVALLTVIAADPEFVAVTVRVFVAPATTLPKSMLAFARDRSPICCWVSLGGLPALRPWQAARKQRLNRSINSCAVFQDLFAAC